MKGRKMKFILLLIPILISSLAQAAGDDAYMVLCGQGREKGSPDQAELAIVDEAAGMRLYLRGEKLSDDRYGIVARDGGWIITVFGSEGRSDRKFTLDAKTRKMQEFILAKESEKAFGEAKRCIFPAE
jgi:hypothetical protein